uniref:Uncharacterized protein n=1 Tax=Heterorhabditis bacteriophora TaxID=37862 RepID=A0A1I7W6B3_HETBA
MNSKNGLGLDNVTIYLIFKIVRLITDYLIDKYTLDPKVHTFDIDGKRVTIFGFRLFSYEVESYINLLIFLIFDIYNKMSLSVLFELRPKSSQYEKSTTSSSFVCITKWRINIGKEY